MHQGEDAIIIEHMFGASEEGLTRRERIAELLRAAADLHNDDLDARSDESIEQDVVDLCSLIDWARGELVRVVGHWDEKKVWRRDGALSAASWLAHRVPIDRTAALRLVHTARMARHHDATADALAAGEVSVSNVETMAAASFGRDDVLCEEEPEVLALARSQQPEEFRTTMRHWRNRADERLIAAGTFDPAERCYLRGRETLGSLVRVDGLFEADGWSSLLNALQPFTQPDRAPDISPRSGGRRLYDALLELAARVCEGNARIDDGERQSSSRPRYAADVVIDYDTLLGMHRGDLRVRVCDIEGLGPVPFSTVERLLCDCAIGRVLMRGRSEVLDQGRRTDVPSRAQRRALRHRDKHCRFPGCDRPARWTDAHHIVHWTRGGPTDLDNLVLLCRRHHKMCHEGGWDLVRNADGSFSAERRSGRAPPGRRAA